MLAHPPSPSSCPRRRAAVILVPYLRLGRQHFAGDHRILRGRAGPAGRRGGTLARRATGLDLNELLADVRTTLWTRSSPSTSTLDTDGYRLLVNPDPAVQEISGPMGDRQGRRRPQDHRRHLRWLARHGGGAFSGKDRSKVDRSTAAYAVRFGALTVVAAGLADRCRAQVAYAIGKAKPVGLFVEVLRHRKGASCPGSRTPCSKCSTCAQRPSSTLTCSGRSTRRQQPSGASARRSPDFSWERTDRVKGPQARRQPLTPALEDTRPRPRSLRDGQAAQRRLHPPARVRDVRMRSLRRGSLFTFMPFSETYLILDQSPSRDPPS